MPEHNLPAGRSFADRCFRDDAGRLVIAQFPNWPLWLWGGASLLREVLPDSPGTPLLDWISLGAIAYWSYLEIFDGVNYFRRALGLMVLLFVLYNRFW